MFAGSEALRSQKLEDFVVGLVGFNVSVECSDLQSVG